MKTEEKLKKSNKKRALTSLIAALLCASVLGGSASAVSFGSLGEACPIRREIIGDSLVYTELTADNGISTQNAYIFEYDPSGGTLPIAIYGEGLYGRESLGAMVRDWSERNILGALNGDFFSMKTGIPMGVMINSGRLVSGDDDPENPRYAVGFTKDGRVIIGKPETRLTLTDLSSSGEPIVIEYYNKYPSVWGAYLLDEHYSDRTTSTKPSLEIVIELESRPESGLPVSGQFKGVVREINTSVMDSQIPEGCAVLSVAEASAVYPKFTDIAVGDELLFETSCAEGWESVVTAIGGGDLILENGVMPEGIIDEEHEKYSNPRTAVGVREDGKVVFFAVDGRSSKSRGLTETELSAVMAELGCVTALNLDGGGSTTVMVKYASSGECTAVNVPSDGIQRKIGNGLLFVPAESPDNIPALLTAENIPSLLLRGSSVEIEALTLDRAYMPSGKPVGELTVSAPEDAGSASGAIFTAGYGSGMYELGLSADGLAGKAYINVTNRLSSLDLSPSYSRALAGNPAKLEIDARYSSERVTCGAESFYYTLDMTHIIPDAGQYPDAMIVCDLGYLDRNGDFVAFEGVSGEVEVGIWFDEFVKFVRVRVGEGAENVAGFEDGTANLFADGTASIESAAPGFRSDYAARIICAGDEKTALRLFDSVSIAAGGADVRLWVTSLPDSPYCTVIDENGVEHRIAYRVTKDYSRQLGWTELTAAIPEKLTDEGLTLGVLLGFSGTENCDFLLDEIVISYRDPEAQAIDGLEGHWASESILALYDMGAIQADDCVRAADGKLSYQPDKALTRGEFAKLLALWLGLDADDQSEEMKFEPDTPEDKLPYIRRVIANRLMSGSGEAEGVTIFRANDIITRQEVCKVLGKLTSADGAAELDFTDSEAVADWALDGISRCVSAGIIGGYEDGTLRPGAPVTRAELAVMLQRAERTLTIPAISGED